VILPPLELAPIKNQKLRDAFWAPEYERYLGVAHLDFSVVDQVEALKVRLLTGVELVERRVIAALMAGLRVQTSICLVLGVAAGAGVSSAVAAMRYNPAVCIAIAALGLVIAFVAGLRWAALRRDMRVLGDLRGRYAEPIVSCGEDDRDRLIETGKEIEAELRLVAAPPRSPDEEG